MYPIYYPPSQSLVSSLQKELQSLQPSLPTINAGEEGSNTSKAEKYYKRGKETRGARAKSKVDALDRVFQAFADVIYFLEFIEDHPELHDLYKKDLKDFFGFNNDPGTRQSHYQYRGGAFERFIRTALFRDTSLEGDDLLDFRVHLIKILINSAIYGMRDRIQDINELNIMDSDVNSIWLWGKLLSSRGNDSTQPARRSFGFSPYKYRRT